MFFRQAFASKIKTCNFYLPIYRQNAKYLPLDWLKQRASFLFF